MSTQIFVNESRGYKTLGNRYKHRYVKQVCPECEYDHIYLDRWHTRLSFKCMRRGCNHNWFKKRWEETADGRRDTYPDYVSQEGLEQEELNRRLH